MRPSYRVFGLQCRELRRGRDHRSKRWPVDALKTTQARMPVLPARQVHQPNGPVIQICRTREIEPLPSIAALGLNTARNPLIPPRTIVDFDPFKVGIAKTVTPNALLHCALAGLNCNTITGDAIASTVIGPEATTVRRFELSRPDAAALKVDRARESIPLVVIISADRKASNNPIIPSRIVVYRYALK